MSEVGQQTGSERGLTKALNKAESLFIQTAVDSSRPFDTLPEKVQLFLAKSIKGHPLAPKG